MTYCSILLLFSVILRCILSVKVLEVVMFLISHNLAGGSEKISVPYAAISQRYDHLRGRGENKYVSDKCSQFNAKSA